MLGEIYNYFSKEALPSWSVIFSDPYRDLIYITVKEKCTIIVVKESEKYGGLYRLQYEVYPDYLSNVECYGEDRIVQVVKDVFNEYAGV